MVLFLVLGPTGICAMQISGQTIHSALHISVKKQFSLLDGKSAKDFCDRMKQIKFLIIDEYSMIGCSMLRYIDLRCRQGTGVNEPFGGLVAYLLGDVAQLPPVIDAPLYGNPKDSYGLQGKALVASFEEVFFLVKCFRQEDTDFLNILDRISSGSSTEEDFKLLSTRFNSGVGKHHDFDSAMNLFATKEEVKRLKEKELGNFTNHETGEEEPVLKITAQHNCQAAAKSSDDDAEGLSKEFFLAKGCKIMLKHNLWLDKGLVNGALGVVENIIVTDDGSFPSVIMCKFPKYSGPCLSPEENIVPFAALTKTSISKSRVSCTRIQFLIVVAYACSKYKSQGLTLEKPCFLTSFCSEGGVEEEKPVLIFPIFVCVLGVLGVVSQD
ncbi:hypothetical protein FOCC_FOCC006582 [Frankliniella occidentalis]|nr:hypothetical protein FOCC_FOCC006582 [Frankliniella occidentalis]